MRNARQTLMALGLAILVALPVSIAVCDRASAASTATEINRDADEALHTLYRTNPVAEDISKNARAVLVFPKIVKAGFIFGGSYGEGALKEGSRVVDYYSSVSGSWGLQAGAQSYAYVVFLMNDKAVDYLKSSKGWEIGVGPTVVIVNEGAAKNLSTSTLKDDAYAFIFGQQGLMAGVSIEGSKISRIKR
ncbi:MAG: lipid-binding SYLF domain-containing protein [Rhodospirillaceae bacterium]